METPIPGKQPPSAFPFWMGGGKAHLSWCSQILPASSAFLSWGPLPPLRHRRGPVWRWHKFGHVLFLPGRQLRLGRHALPRRGSLCARGCRGETVFPLWGQQTVWQGWKEGQQCRHHIREPFQALPQGVGQLPNGYSRLPLSLKEIQRGLGWQVQLGTAPQGGRSRRAGSGTQQLSRGVFGMRPAA